MGSNKFVPLDELVYAPLQALAESNQRLESQVVDTIRNMGTVTEEEGEEVVRLEHLNVAYEQMRQEDGTYRVDELQMQVPLLSIVPVANMGVEKAKIQFSTEVYVNEEALDGTALEGRICAPETRDGDCVPRISYEIKVKAAPAAEGYMRLTDLLYTNSVTRKTAVTPIDADGTAWPKKEKHLFQKIERLRIKAERMKQMYREIQEQISEQEKQLNGAASDSQPDFIEKLAKLADEILKVQEQILALELQCADTMKMGAEDA